MRKTGCILRNMIRVGFFLIALSGVGLLAEAVRKDGGATIDRATSQEDQQAQPVATDVLADGKRSSRGGNTGTHLRSGARGSGSAVRQGSSTRSSQGSRPAHRSSTGYPRRNVDHSSYHGGQGHNRSHNARGTSRHYYYPGNHYPMYFGFGYGHYYNYGWGYDWYNWPGLCLPWPFYAMYWLGNPYYSHYTGYYGDADSGAIDLNIKPKKARIYLNGFDIGTVNKYDGWPDYLWLKEGTYELIFYLEGHETTRKIYEVHPGVVLRENMELARGEALAPAELSAPPKMKAPERRPETYATYNRGVERTIPDHPQARRRYLPPGAKVPEEQQTETRDLRIEPARVSFVIEPEDASVYLDGKLIGSAAELQSTDKLLLDAGEHHLEIIRPGFQTDKQLFNVESGKTLNLTISLQKE